MSIYSIVRAHAVRTRLLKYEDYEVLLKARDVSEFIKLLGRTSYSSIIRGLGSKPKYIEFKRALLNKYLSTYKVLARGVSEDYRDFLTDYVVGRLEVENLKFIIRSKVLGKGIKYLDLINVRYLVDTAYVAKIDDFRELITYLSSYYPSILEGLKVYEVFKLPDFLEFLLDMDYYDRVRERAIRAGLGDESKFIDEEASLVWLKWLLNFKLRPNLKVENYEALVSRFHCSLSVKEPQLIYSDVTTITKALGKFVGSNELGEELRYAISRGDFIAIDVILEKSLRRIVEYYVRRAPLDSIFIILVLALLRWEVSNLCSIFLSKEVGLDPEDTRSILIL